jgi:hypothetical protein
MGLLPCCWGVEKTRCKMTNLHRRSPTPGPGRILLFHFLKHTDSAACGNMQQVTRFLTDHGDIIA